MRLVQRFVRSAPWVLTLTGALAIAPAASAASDDAQPPSPASPSQRILASIADAPLRALLGEVLERNPDLASRAATARAAARKAPQAGALPDPMAGVTDYLQTPETRVGPQRAMFSLSQRFPWFGKRGLRAEAARRDADASDADVEAARLRVLTKARDLYYELAFLDSFESVTREDRGTLVHFEEVARARYTSGVGLEQAVVKIQAEITKTDARLLDISTRRAALLAQVNALRDRPEGTAVDVASVPDYLEVPIDLEALRRQALRNRPEVGGADAAVSRAEAMTRLAKKEYAPDITLGLAYGLVGQRDDPAGAASPPPDNGQDVFGVTLGVNLPIWRGRLSAGVDEAQERQVGAEQGRRAVIADIERSLGDLGQRLPLTWQRLRLFQDVLTVQAGESLRSAESAYGAGTLNALDLLDAERVLLEVRVAAARARTDYAVAVSDLEGAIAAPVRAQ